MAIHRVILSVIVAVVITSTSTIHAQINTNQTNSEIDSEFIFSLWGGYSFNSIRFLGKTPDSQTTIIGIGMKKLLKEYPNGNRLYYSTDIIPYLQYQYPKRDEAWKRSEGTGFGISPIGFYLIKPLSNNFFPFVQASGGAIYMDQLFPTDLARKLNFTFDVTIGTRLKIADKNVLTFGYKFHHISNAQTGSENPGLDSNFLFLSFSI
ncbi:MAG: acyloxyacyl hydrolase [Balneolaceae bacterium]